MSKEVIIAEWCDLCEEKVKSERTITWGYVQDTQKPRLHELDLCLSHLETVAKYFGNLLDASRDADPNSQVTSSKIVDSEVHCPICSISYTAKHSLVYHIWRIHNMIEPPKQPAKCPNCGQKFIARSMGIHRKIHGYDSLDEAVDYWEQHKNDLAS